MCQGGTQLENAGCRPLETHFQHVMLDPELFDYKKLKCIRVNIRAYIKGFLLEIVCLGKYSRRYKFNIKMLADIVQRLISQNKKQFLKPD